MPFHRCTIRHQDGTLVARDVEVMIEETERQGAVEWYGTVTVVHPVNLAPSERYRAASVRAGRLLTR
jgi:hypothetical protein